MKFSYNKKYKKNRYTNINRNFEREIIEYLKKEFSELDLNSLIVQLEPSGYFEGSIAGKAIIQNNTIILDYDKFSFLIAQKRSKVWDQSVYNNNNYVYHILHHEACHLRNNIVLRPFFHAIKESNSINIIKTAIHSFVDEFIATSEAQKKYRLIQDARIEIIELVHQICNYFIIRSVDTTRDRFVYFVEVLAYAVVEDFYDDESDLSKKYNSSIFKLCENSYNKLNTILKQYPHIDYTKHIDIMITVMIEIATSMGVDLKHWEDMDLNGVKYDY